MRKKWVVEIDATIEFPGGSDIIGYAVPVKAWTPKGAEAKAFVWAVQIEGISPSTIRRIEVKPAEQYADPNCTADDPYYCDGTCNN